MVDVDWLNYSIALQDVTRFVKGSTRSKLNQRELKKVPIPLPGLSEQQRIVGRIRACLERVQELRRLRLTSLTEAASLEGSVFADFVADRVRKDGAAETVRLSEITVRSQYGSSSKANVRGEGVPILRMGNIKDGHLDTTDLKHLRLPPKELDKYRLKEGDILFNRTNSLELVGKAATFTGLAGDWVFASYLIRLEVDRQKALPEYVTAVINSRIGRSYVYRTARRAIGMVNINAKQIQQLELPLPPLPAQRELVERLREAKTASDSIRSELSMEPVDALPGAILRRAFAGIFRRAHESWGHRHVKQAERTASGAHLWTRLAEFRDQGVGRRPARVGGPLVRRSADPPLGGTRRCRTRSRGSLRRQRLHACDAEGDPPGLVARVERSPLGRSPPE